MRWCGTSGKWRRCRLGPRCWRLRRRSRGRTPPSRRSRWRAPRRASRSSSRKSSMPTHVSRSSSRKSSMPTHASRSSSRKSSMPMHASRSSSRKSSVPTHVSAARVGGGGALQEIAARQALEEELRGIRDSRAWRTIMICHRWRRAIEDAVRHPRVRAIDLARAMLRPSTRDRLYRLIGRRWMNPYAYAFDLYPAGAELQVWITRCRCPRARHGRSGLDRAACLQRRNDDRGSHRERPRPDLFAFRVDRRRRRIDRRHSADRRGVRPARSARTQ